MPLAYILFYATLVWNSAAFCIMGIDKALAVYQKSRISENSLLLISLCFGSIGTILGMIIFRHKIRKRKFQIFPAMFLALQIILIHSIIKII